ncbi:MAG TPA: glycoside hydrolase family 43 protein [Lachnospiraceae bacterium]|nr:glycoside hydrolase family 43 protein [Lachnospiraceae bacterium]
MTQRFGADPCVIVYEDTVYVYMTGDNFAYDKDETIKTNDYGNIQAISIIGSKDLVNWTDYGSINATEHTDAAKWASMSWAPSVTYKEIDGKIKFFLYFANSGGGIGVLEAETPIGPFTDPIGRALITKRTPNCSNVTWLFDPAVFIDDDGIAYLYFGGGIPEEKDETSTIRVVKLGEDMISLDGEPIVIDVPYVFEDSGMNKMEGIYYYSYCSNWNVSKEAKEELGIASAQICYMTGDNPMGPFKLQGAIFKNPGDYFQVWGNNHHCIFEFRNNWYIAYHTQLLEKMMGYEGYGYRSTHIDSIIINDNGTIGMQIGTKAGVKQAEYMDPYVITEAETMATMAGISTILYGTESKNHGSGNMVVSDIQTGDWMALKGVDFGDIGAQGVKANICASKEQYGMIQIRVDGLYGDVIGYIEIKPEEHDDYYETTAQLLHKVTGIHDMFFIFYGEEYTWDTWQFVH